MQLKPVVQGLLLAGLVSTSALAQDTQRIVITGSSIKRINTEGALPIQTIRRVELDREGIVTAEQVVMMLSTNGSGLDNLASNADVVGGAQRGNNGATSANLRGQGSNATLILLNGRRVAAHGLNGGTVDLNQIPMSAVDRIEILKDGASAIYGTDAIGGVINFILRNNYRGASVQGLADITQEGGGNIFRGSVVAGAGDLVKDGFNLLGTLAYSDNQALRGNQRDFVNTFQPARGLSVDTRGTPFATIFPLAGTIIPSAATAPFVPGSTTVRPSGGINVLDLPGGLGCGSIDGQAPYDDRLWASPTSQLACAWDTGRAAVLQQPIKNLNLVTRGTLQLGEHQISAELTASKADSAKRFSNLQLTPNTTTQQLRYPSTAPNYTAVFDRLVAAFPSLAPQRGQPIAYRWRCIECGPREITTETDTARLFIGVEGPLMGWDYRVGVSQATSESQSTLGGGYYFRGTNANGTDDPNTFGIIDALNSGRVNVFLFPGEAQSADGLAALEQASARGVVLYGGKFTMQQTDATLSGPVFKLPGGQAMAAVGVDFRTEKYKFNGDQRAAAARPVIIAAPFDDGNALTGVKRDVKAVFTELVMPLFKSLEANIAVRHDEYDGFGSTTNPKLTLRYKPLDTFLMRGSYGTGFRVPTFNQLYNGPTSAIYTGADLADPATCPTRVVNPNVAGCAAIRPEIINGGKTDLGPEEAKMATLGFVFEPVPSLSLTADIWKIEREGTIQLLSLAQLTNNYTLFPDRFIRDANGALVSIDQRWINAGQTATKGIEVSVRGALDAMGARWTAAWDISYLLGKKSRLLPSVPFGRSEIGQFSFAGDLSLRWKHSASLTARQGPWSATLSQIYRSSYYDQVLPGVQTALNTNQPLPPLWKPKVSSYSTYNLSATYTGVKDLSLTGMVKNVFNTDPPFAVAYDSNFGSGSSWEPRVADPRGRSFVISAEYKFF
jgi:iron complex outermembrane recepter protein